MNVTEPEAPPEGSNVTGMVDRAWRTHAPVVLRFATALVGPHDAEDVAANAFLRTIGRRGWQKIERLDYYLLRAVRNEANNLYRSRQCRWERDLNAVRPIAMTDIVSDVDLWQAVAQLTIQQRSIVYLAYWQDLTEAEIAETLDLTRSSVHRTLGRARIALGKALR
jgi:RNA polymerase sigma factor (sigma-70 family)